MPKTVLANGLALLLLTACTAGPDYRAKDQRYVVTPPETFSAAHERGDFGPAHQRFWQGFEDPLLEQLVQQTLLANQTLLGAMARYERADALLDGARRNQRPSITAEALASETHPSSLEPAAASGGPARIETYRAGVLASWELDLFGRLRRIREVHEAELAAAGADLQALRVAMVGDLASSYFRLRGLQSQLNMVKRNVALYARSLEIIGARVDAGRGTDFDRLRARTQLDRARADLPSLEADIRTEMHRIAVLTGREPGALIEVLGEAQSLSGIMPVIPVDSPGELLRRRPDIIAAEQRLAAATAQIDVASADLFPRFTLGGLLGSVAADPGDLFTGPAETRHVTLGIDWTFLDRGRVRARIDAADADSRAAFAEYQQAVLRALEEAENRLVQYNRIQQRVQFLAQAEAQAHEAVALARTRHDGGLIAYFEVLAAEQELVAAREAAVQSRTAEVLAMVDVYRALAGPPDAGDLPHP